MVTRTLFKLLAGVIAISSIVFTSPVPPREVQMGKRAVSPVDSRIIVDSNGVYMRASKLNDGNIIGGYGDTEGDNRVLRAARSNDGGASWQPLGIVASANPDTTDLDNSYPIQLPNGRILFVFRNHDKADGGWSYYRITLCYSDDGGVTWAYLTQIEERAANGVNGIWEPLLRLSNNGTLQVYYSSENEGNDQDNIMKISLDNGATWSGQTLVSGGGATSRDGMVGVANIDGNGNVM